jgi:hypothetical protein
MANCKLNMHGVEEPRPFLAISQPWVCARIAEPRFAPTAVWNVGGIILRSVL